MNVKSSFKKHTIVRLLITLEQVKALSSTMIMCLVISLFFSSCNVKQALKPLRQNDPQAQINPSCETVIIKTILDPQQNLIIAGNTNAATLPIKNAIQKKMLGEKSGFVAQISQKGEILCESQGRGC